MKITGKVVLDLKMQPNDAEAGTIRDYLKTLLFELFTKGESFSGKRPFGNSGWEYELYYTLVKHNFISGEIDEEYGDLVEFHEEDGNTLIYEAIRCL